MAESEINFENGAQETAWSGDEFERVPLKQRLKLLLASHRMSVDSDLKSESQIPVIPPWVTDSSAFFPVTVKIECADNHFENSSANCMNGSYLAGTQAAVNFEPEMSDEYRDDLEHVVLKERLRRLLTSLVAGTVRGEQQFGDERHVVSGKQIHEIDRILKSGTSKDTLNSSCKPHQALDHCSRGYKSTYADSLGIQRNDMTCSSEKECSKYESDGKKTLLSGNTRTLQGSAVSILANIKIEPPCYNEFQTSKVAAPGQMSFGDLVLVKTEVKTADDACEDELDHMLLRERMKLLSSRDCPSLDINQSSKCMSETVPSAFGCRPVASKPAQAFKVNRPRKRRKTVTDSVETAMEEDAPGLLKVLVENGVSIDEIKLYGEPESDDALEDSSTKDNFAELEEVITKLFSQRESLLKFGPLRCAKGEKASYCLECLFSLVEQVGDDLTEGEARVLMDYGWIPNTGLGTMLNYYDRVVHDRRNERDRSEWKSKIGKLLMDGYNGGTIISSSIPKKAMESDVTHPVEIKLEFN
ncbi:hypothetical protein DH2020_038800 [Rehmannia glutinosa]|uniref:Uncharacterized protein n=1 Tax=Rehmannia glutinosa TaxID=99300 RepID=A0ABR0V069_REHGL